MTPSYLLSRPAGYHFRIRVPADLRPTLGRSEIKRSLAKFNRLEALSEARRLCGIVERLFEEVRNTPDAWSPTAFTQTWWECLRNTHTSAPLKHVVPEEPVKTSPPLSSVIQKFTDEQILSGRWQAKTQSENEGIYRLAIQIIGDVPITALNYEILRNYKNTLCTLPANLNKVARFRNRSISDILEMNPPPRSTHCTNKHLSRVSGFLNWCVRHGYVASNYCSGFQIKKTKQASDERRVFSSDEL